MMRRDPPGVAPDVLLWLSRLGFAYMSIFTLVVYLTAFFVIIPATSRGDIFQTGFQRFAATYLFLGLLCNCYMLYREDSFIPLNSPFKLDKEHNFRSGWIDCKICNLMAPPRSHHCVLCQRCVLTREHHCFFTGFCVGQKNLKHYLVFCYYCSLGCLYSLFLIIPYMSNVYFSPFSWRIFHYFLPLTFLETIFGLQSWDFLFFVLLTYVTLTGCLGSAAAFFWHLKLAIIGKTSYEYFRGLPGHDRGCLKNVKLIFGDYWLLNFIFPISFKTIQHSASVKII